MEIKVEQGKLSRALASVSRVAAGARTTLPILTNVLIRADGNKVSLTATNLDMAVVEFVPVISATDGVITVPAKILAEFVSNLPRGEVVTLKADGFKVKISAGAYTSTINGVSADDFPELPEIEEKSAVKYKMGLDEFKVGISEVIVAAGNDTTRPVLMGVLFSTAENNLYVAATDGYRLAEKEFIKGVSSEVKAIVPAASLQEVMRSMTEDMDEMEIVFDETQVRFRMGEMEITSKLIDGTFPDYRVLFPKKMDIEVLLDRSELIRIVKMASVFSQEVNQAIICEADAEKQVFVISSILNEVGENRSEIKTKIEKSGKIRADARYLMTALNALEEPVVKFEMPAEKGPIVVRNEKSNNYRHLVMSLKNDY
ncbi:DNA polymerase III subunit beta [Candidatus Saccharibacteria bacterium]|nr:DNA polymerase III subunit beta [Candidatus Saccharibacteria bacterium]MBQ9017089.1 DNA polymerase III subunit beta [Candidatus Saccharibacteria bacterium]